MAMKQYISLSEPLCGIDTYKDVLNVKTGATTRIIKKMVLDGNTVVKKKSGNAPFQIYCPHGIKPPTDGIYWLCSHYPAVPNTTTWTTYDYLISFSVGDMGESENDYFRIRDTSRASYNADQFSDYLAQQYANGTPVTVWYILVTPETSVTTLPKGLSGMFEGSLTQTGTPTPASPIYPTANSINAFLNKKYFRYEASTDTITTLPSDLYADGTTATVGLVGNMSQSGTPSPTTPIQPSECGDRTGNLFDKSATAGNIYVTASAIRYGVEIPVTAGTYTVSGGTSAFFAKTKINNVYGSALTTETARILELSADGLILLYSDTENNYNNGKGGVMLVKGSTASSSYIPYGYKITFSSAGQTTPIYLGEVETERKIKKIKASDISWIDGSSTSYNFYRGTLTIPKLAGGGISTLLSNKYRSVNIRNNMLDGDIASYNLTTDETIVIRDDRYSSAADWLSANGDTEIWYVLATPQTAVVNEPLMKIGDYADSISNVSIPTIAGANTLSVDTTVQPSEVTVNYKGWHPVQNVHEAENGAWD